MTKVPPLCLCSKILSKTDLLGVITTAHGIGYRGVELFGIDRHLPARTPIPAVRACGNLAKQLGIGIVVLDTYVGEFEAKSDAECDEQVEVFKRYLEMAVILDCALLRVNPKYLGHGRAATDDEIRRFADWTAKCADLAEPLGKDVVLEHNLNMIATVAGTLRVLAAVGRGNVGLNYDPGNIYRVDDGYAETAVAAFKDRIRNVQVKQCDREGDRIDLLMEEGKVDYRKVFLALKTIGYQGYLSAECHRPADGLMGEEAIARHEFERIRALRDEVWAS
jgi:sugar phosphate isomerase/epimerase